jgi:hypothetical protein
VQDKASAAAQGQSSSFADTFASLLPETDLEKTRVSGLYSEREIKDAIAKNIIINLRMDGNSQSSTIWTLLGTLLRRIQDLGIKDLASRARLQFSLHASKVQSDNFISLLFRFLEFFSIVSTPDFDVHLVEEAIRHPEIIAKYKSILPLFTRSFKGDVCQTFLPNLKVVPFSGPTFLYGFSTMEAVFINNDKIVECRNSLMNGLGVSVSEMSNFCDLLGFEIGGHETMHILARHYQGDINLSTPEEKGGVEESGTMIEIELFGEEINLTSAVLERRISLKEVAEVVAALKNSAPLSLLHWSDEICELYKARSRPFGFKNTINFVPWK